MAFAQVVKPLDSGSECVTLFFVKQVLSGDSVILRGQPTGGGPPQEKQVTLSNIIAPKLAQQPTDPSAVDSNDEPFAWEAREFLRKKVVGKAIGYAVDDRDVAIGREYGIIYLGEGMFRENVAECLVAEGLVEVHQVTSNQLQDERLQRLNALQETAKASGKGKWGPAEVLQQHVRDVKWTLPASQTPRDFVHSLKREPVKAVIEHVRDGSTVRAFLLSSFQYVTVMISGIKCPGFEEIENGRVSARNMDTFAEDAKNFTEELILQRDVEILVEGFWNQHFLGTILHPTGNIAELLLAQGLAECDWSMSVVSSGADNYRYAESFAKEKCLCLWESYELQDTPLYDISKSSEIHRRAAPDQLGLWSSPAFEENENWNVRAHNKNECVGADKAKVSGKDVSSSAANVGAPNIRHEKLQSDDNTVVMMLLQDLRERSRTIDERNRTIDERNRAIDQLHERLLASTVFGNKRDYELKEINLKYLRATSQLHLRCVMEGMERRYLHESQYQLAGTVKWNILVGKRAVKEILVQNKLFPPAVPSIAANLYHVLSKQVHDSYVPDSELVINENKFTPDECSLLRAIVQLYPLDLNDVCIIKRGDTVTDMLSGGTA